LKKFLECYKKIKMKKLLLGLIILFTACINNAQAEYNRNHCPWIWQWEDDGLCEFVYKACNTEVKYFNPEKKILKSYIQQKPKQKTDKISVWEISNAKEKINGRNFSEYPDTSPFKVAQVVYKSNMSNLYDCAIFSSKMYAIDWVMASLENDKVSKQILKRLRLYKKELERQSKEEWNLCNYKQWVEVEKEDMLNETTYEMCKYISTLRYYEREYMDKPVFEDIIPEEEKSQIDWTVFDSRYYRYLTSLKSNIEKEIQHTYDIYETAFTAYKEFDSNFRVHLYLELLKTDFLVLRNALHDTLVPLNQLPTKIVWAMSK